MTNPMTQRMRWLIWLLIFSFTLPTMPFGVSANAVNTKVTVYYKNSNFSKVFFHYAIGSGSWTSVPGIQMASSDFPGYFVTTIPLTTAGSEVQAAFNNGGNLWDNNASKNYKFLAGVYTVENTAIRTGNPVGIVDTSAPSVPADVAVSSVTSSTINLSWSHATDNVKVFGYEVYRNQTRIANVTSNTFTDSNLLPLTDYTYTIVAFDSAGNKSGASVAFTTKTASGLTAKVYYKVPSGTVSYIHYRSLGGNWTTAPGLKMEASEVAGFNVITINLGTASGFEAAFNNGTGVWDSNGGKNYIFSSGISNLNNGKITAGVPDNVISNKVTVYYKPSSGGVSYIHYRPNGGVWTNAPGQKMDPSEVTGFNKITIDIGTASGLEAAFNNGSGVWDSNGMKNYFFASGTFNVSNGIIKTGAPEVIPVKLSFLGNISQSPVQGALTASDQLVITAQTKTLTTASKVELVYSTDGGTNWVTVAMNKGVVAGDADTWQINLGKFARNTVIKYWLKATDAAGIILVNDNNKASYSTTVEDKFISVFPQVYFRGTNNGWSNTDRMQLIADYTWQFKATFSGAADDRFKFDVDGNWMRNYGDNNDDLLADLQANKDIYTQGVAGEYVVTFNDQTLRYQVAAPSIKVSSVLADFSTYNLQVGEVDYLGATVLPSNALNKNVTWTSSNPAIVEVTDGMIKAVAVGTAEIVMASSENPSISTKTTVTVSENTKHPVFSDPNLNYVFDKTALPEITVEVSTAEWNKFLANYDANPKNEIEVAADFTFSKNGETEKLTNIGLRLRGNTSRRRPEGNVGEPHNPTNPDWKHAHFAFKFAKFNKTQRFRGMQDLNTKWFKDDANYAREVYGYDLYARNNVWTTPFSSYAKLTIKIKEDSKPAYFGVYEMIEAINQDYINKRFPVGNNLGDLWKCNNNEGGIADLTPADLDNRIGIEDPDNYIYKAYDLKTNKKTIDTIAKPQLVQFINTLNSTEATPEWLEKSIDLNLFYKYLAVNVGIGSWDDFWRIANNYYMYFDQQGKMYMIPYDYDNTLGTSEGSIDAGKQNPLQWGPLDSTRPLPFKILSVPANVEKYKAALLELTKPENNLLDAKKSMARIKAWNKLIAPHVVNDTGEDMVIEDVPAYWGSTNHYRLLSGDDNTNFFKVKTNAIQASVLAPTTTTIYYKRTNFNSAYIHFKPTENGAWTNVPGMQMQTSEFPGYFKIVLTTEAAKAAFNNGAGVWDNNNSTDYTLPFGTWTITDGIVRQGAPLIISTTRTMSSLFKAA